MTEFKNLMQQANIVIKETDKVGAARVLSREHHRAMIYEHHNNQNKHQKLDKNLDLLLQKKKKQTTIK